MTTAEWTSRPSSRITYDRTFRNEEGHIELCHHTGNEVFLNGVWRFEFVDSLGGLHYGN